MSFQLEPFTPEIADLYDGLSWLANKTPDSGRPDFAPTAKHHRIARQMRRLLPMVPGHWIGENDDHEIVDRFRYESDAQHALRCGRVAYVRQSQS